MVNAWKGTEGSEQHLMGKSIYGNDFEKNVTQEVKNWEVIQKKCTELTGRLFCSIICCFWRLDLRILSHCGAIAHRDTSEKTLKAWVLILKKERQHKIKAKTKLCTLIGRKGFSHHCSIFFVSFEAGADAVMVTVYCPNASPPGLVLISLVVQPTASRPRRF